MSSNTYSFLEVQAAITGPGGLIPLGNGSGNAQEGITIRNLEDINSMMIGADGSGQHSLRANKAAEVTVRLLKTSPTNALLMAMYNFQTMSARTHGQNTISLRDTARGDVITCEMCAFRKAPDLEYGTEAGMIDWVFDSVRTNRVLGA